MVLIPGMASIGVSAIVAVPVVHGYVAGAKIA